MKVDNIIAIRNGLSVVDKEHHLLKTDKFGKITYENDHKIETVDEKNNRSGCSYERKLVKKQ